VPNYRLVFRSSPKESPIKSVSFRGKDPGEALLIAQRHKCPVELWSEDEHICTLSRAGSEGLVWIISNREAAT
jgi:hypothetical protein